MSTPRYPEEFKAEAVKQVTERGLPVAEVAARVVDEAADHQLPGYRCIADGGLAA